jgi:hypothetical protein
MYSLDSVYAAARGDHACIHRAHRLPVPRMQAEVSHRQAAALQHDGVRAGQSDTEASPCTVGASTPER